MTFTFNSRDTYLQFRREWKEQYFHLIAQVRKAKNDIKNSTSAYAKGKGSIGDLWTAHADKRNANQDVEKHLRLLWDARIEAERQVRARKEVNERDQNS